MNIGQNKHNFEGHFVKFFLHVHHFIDGEGQLACSFGEMYILFVTNLKEESSCFGERMCKHFFQIVQMALALETTAVAVRLLAWFI